MKDKSDSDGDQGEPITELIRAAREGDGPAVDRLFVALYRDLHRLARAKLRQNRPLVDVDTTTVLHESYLRFNRLQALDIEDRKHFFTYAARVMRSVIVDLVRNAQAERRGGGQMHVTLSTEVGASIAETQLLEVHEALAEMEAVEPRLVRVVEARFFAGLTEEETANALNISDRTVRRDWEKARVMIAAIMKGE